MKSAFILGEAALKLYSTTIDTKNVLLQTSKLEQVMNLLDDKTMMKSILFYPVTRRLRMSRRHFYLICLFFENDCYYFRLLNHRYTKKMIKFMI